MSVFSDKKSVADDTYDSDSMTNNTDNSRSLTDASDVSDVEETDDSSKKSPLTNACRGCFPPDSRNELFLERLSSPADLKNSSTMSSTAVSTLTFASSLVPLLFSSIPSSDSTATISTSAVSPTISSLVGKTVKESGSGSKSKIWSIESIISG
ncbi:hypothetical protein DPMN_162598 [Dreissena polymorpha]|uniref:Uncharacterized protein n=1 Tax=Dreissena polymorpha TaxID=45954 RepID=A0A9D4EV64_DREPO|nr:hypothetical protein DPMN_162598 [Dreissena polymorpha]